VLFKTIWKKKASNKIKFIFYESPFSDTKCKKSAFMFYFIMIKPIDRLKGQYKNNSFLTENIGNLMDGFFVMASRSAFGQFKFESQIINRSNFENLIFTPDFHDLTNFGCLTARLNVSSKKLDLYITDCSERHIIICRKVDFIQPNCSEKSAFKKQSAFSLLLNPNSRLRYKQGVAYQKAEIMDMFKRIHMEKAYQSLFQTLWYSFIPCFDVRNITTSLSEMSLLRYCEWRGIPIDCSSIFTTFPTDQGLCCSFNMKAADEIYRDSIYKVNLQVMQNSDKINSFKSVPPSATYTPTNAPQAGKNRGLVLLLDAHSDWLFPGSFDGDFHTLTTVIQSSGSFPIMNQGGVIIRPGYDNIITLTSSKIHADENLRSLDKRDKKLPFSRGKFRLNIAQKLFLC
jgi:hypothetical protein